MRIDFRESNRAPSAFGNACDMTMPQSPMTTANRASSPKGGSARAPSRGSRIAIAWNLYAADACRHVPGRHESPQDPPQCSVRFARAGGGYDVPHRYVLRPPPPRSRNAASKIASPLDSRRRRARGGAGKPIRRWAPSKALQPAARSRAARRDTGGRPAGDARLDEGTTCRARRVSSN